MSSSERGLAAQGVDMQSFMPLNGWILILPDSDETRSAGGIIFPDERRRKRTSGTVILHNPTDWWLSFNEAPLDGKAVVFEKWSWRLFPIAGLYLVREGSIFGVLQTSAGDDMTRDELIGNIFENLKTLIESEIPTNTDLSDEQISAVQGLVESCDVEGIVEDLEGGEDDEVEDEDEPE